MVSQKFSIDVVRKVRLHIQSQLTLPPSEQQPVESAEQREVSVSTADLTSLDALGDLFRVGGFGDEETSAPNTEGRWFISTVDPAAAIGLNWRFC